MKKIKNFFSSHPVTMQTLCSLALITATVAANTRCIYIYHDPKKPSALEQLKKF